MNIFITGVTGFLGSNLVKQLVPDVRINKIYMFTRKSHSANADSRIKYIKGDLDTIKNIVLEEKIDAVIHLAADVRGDNVKKLYKVNVEGTSNVIEFCRRNCIRKLIFTSSVNVYLKHKGAYARTKILAEDMVRDSGLEYCIFRLAAVYGLNDGGISRIIDFIRKYRIVPVFGDGKKLEQPIYIDEATEFLHKALFLRKFNITVDVCGKTSMSYNEMLILLGKVLNTKVILFHISANFIIFIINFLTMLKLPCPLTIEQIYHIDEDLSRHMTQEVLDFSVNLQDMEVNLRKYIPCTGRDYLLFLCKNFIKISKSANIKFKRWHKNMKPVIAVFDFDGTIIENDSLIDFLIFIKFRALSSNTDQCMIFCYQRLFQASLALQFVRPFPHLQDPSQ